MNRAQLRANVRANLNDTVATYYTDDEINESLQEAYNTIAIQSYCIIKSHTDTFVDNATYYDFKSLGVDDYLATIAIFNTNTNTWLRDDLSPRDLDRLRRDWEVWNGQPMFWTPHSIQRVAIVPKLTLYPPGPHYTLWYWATAPIFTTDSDVPLVAGDMQTLFEWYCTADLLETSKELNKASIFWDKYFNSVESYKERCVRAAKSDVLLRI